MSANDSGNGTGIWGVARLAAPALVALVLAGVALPWILDSGTAHLPAIGVGVTTGSASGPPAVAKIVVTTPAQSAGTQHHSHSSAAPAVAAQTPNSATASSGPVGGQAVSNPVVHHPAPQTPAGAGRTATPPKPVTKPSSGSPTPPPANEPAANAKHDTTQSSATTSHPGLALGHQKHELHGKADQDKGQRPHGLALGHRNHVPPGQARREGPPPHGLALGHRNHVPPGQARKSSESHGHGESRGHGGDEQGQDSQGDDSDEQGDSSHGHHGDTPPGHADRSHGNGSHGRGHGH